MTKNQRSKILLLIIFVSVYTITYLIKSKDGSYQALAYGPQKDDDGQIILAPKKSFGNYWAPFDLWTEDGSLTYSALFFYPLIELDRLLWHSKKGDLSPI